VHFTLSILSRKAEDAGFENREEREPNPLSKSADGPFVRWSHHTAGRAIADIATVSIELC
jgi:hypothetical protein